MADGKKIKGKIYSRDYRDYKFQATFGEVKKAKDTYIHGMRIRLLNMDDPQAPPNGTEGTVLGVDDIGSIIVIWDNGSRLNAVIGEDRIEIIG